MLSKSYDVFFGWLQETKNMLRFFQESKQQKLQSWLNYMQKEFESNQQMLMSLQRLKKLEEQGHSAETKRMKLKQHPFSEYYFNQLLGLNSQKLDEVMQKLMQKQNVICRNHHSYQDWQDSIQSAQHRIER